jgi:hypothetical protein
VITKNSVFICFIAYLVAFFTSCEESKIDALEDERGIYSIYSALNLDESPNYIRIKDLRTALGADSSNLDATVEFENLETGITTILKDTVVSFDGGITTNNFILNEDLEPRKSYQITVTRSDGNSVSSIATTPGLTIHSITPSESVDCFSEIQLVFDNVLPSEQIRLEVSIASYESRTFEISQFCTFEREENTASLTLTTRDFLGMLFPAKGVNLITCRGTESEITCEDLESPKITIRYLHLGPEWQKVYPLYPNDPEDIMDVENGLGFFGGYRDETLSYTVQIPERD